MTCIAAVADGTTVWMAADTATQVQGVLLHEAATKVLQMKVESSEDQALIGVAGSGAFNRFSAETLPAPGRDLHEWANTCSDQLTEWAISRSLLDSDGDLDGTLLLGFRGHLWFLVKSQAGRIPRGFAAIGSGGDLATGALAVQADVPAEIRVRAAVKVACDLEPWCCEPITVLSV